MRLDSRAQISIELIIVLAAVVAIVLLLVTQLQETSTEGRDKIKSTAKSIFDKIENDIK
ncbi:MAG TPA: hypothetical protein HA252_06940 [Candidatus Diapherotrites archaeon]|uniref:Class III signal peptide-containing protein n=1 Tax=Candidatus Iainarchaeum sp. TaxID=3101447 RepID=A0A7J4JH84_9ARCH|nr:hypothetical protein [Candidatus Diapherotrites archaeon]HIH17112.1 hypothetical protein [Candidatus Diapherotrites archaeon]